MGIGPASISRWEAGQRMGASAERLLRLAVSVGTPAQDYSLDHLATDLSETTEHVPMRFECARVFKLVIPILVALVAAAGWLLFRIM
jgi:hypothetical protein